MHIYLPWIWQSLVRFHPSYLSLLSSISTRETRTRRNCTNWKQKPQICLSRHDSASTRMDEECIIFLAHIYLFRRCPDWIVFLFSFVFLFVSFFFFFCQLCIPMTPFWGFLCIEEEKWGTTFIHVPILYRFHPEFPGERNLYELWKVGEPEKPVFSGGHCKPRVDSCGTLCLMHFAISSCWPSCPWAALGWRHRQATSPLFSRIS